jgi:transposase
MGVAVGIDIAKEFHWVRAVSSGDSRVLLDRRVENDPASIQSLIDELQLLGAEHGALRAGIDVIGGIAGLVAAMLNDAGIEVVHVSGLAVNRARQGTVGGEHKSDPRDAAVIADQVRHRRDLRPVDALSEIDAGIRLLVGRRRELVVDQTRRIARLRDLLTSIFPGLERIVDPSQKGSVQLLSRYVTPSEIRRAGRRRLIDHIARGGRLSRKHVEALADAALGAAQTQTITVPGERVAADLVRELALEVAAAKQRLAVLDADLEAALERHPDAALIRSLPGMGVTLTAEFIAEAGSINRFATPDQLAAAAGLAPVLKQSGKVRYLKRATTGNRALKRVFFQSAFCSLNHPTSRAFYARKRAERKTHHQAVIALARRRVDVLHAMLRNRQPYQVRPAKAA